MPDVPTWNDPSIKAGTMVRGALWLLQRVGEGGIFTKEDVREAFPGVSQADRRIRDLRSYGWVIHTNNDDASLLAEDQRFVAAGVAVWDWRARKIASAEFEKVTAKKRREVLARDDYQCTACGIVGGESYLEDPSQTATLAVTRREIVALSGDSHRVLTTECAKCRAGHDGITVRSEDVVAALGELNGEDRQQLANWIRRGRRQSTTLDRCWRMFGQLSELEQETIAARYNL